MIAIGVDSEGVWFVWEPIRRVGKNKTWTPEQERLFDLTEDQVRILVTHGVVPDFSARPEEGRSGG